MRRISVFFSASVAVLLFAVDDGRPVPSMMQAAAAQRVPAGLPPSAGLLLRYDADHDGVVTREEMEAGLKADYASADTDSDNCLEPAEVRVENERRLQRDGQEASPLVDWNLDGCVDIREFSNTAHSYFDLADRTRDGRVSSVELRGPSAPIPPRTAPTRQQQQQQQQPTEPSPLPPGTAGTLGY